MSNTATLLRQHAEALDIINKISSLADNKGIDDNIKDIVLNINSLAGKLKLHLMTEDKFLLPGIMKNNNIEHLARGFFEEMGNVANEFAIFTNQYNTQTKIMQNKEAFQSESKRIFTQIIGRMHKEEQELYPLFDGIGY